MCGRYALTSPPELIATLFGITLLGQIRARYNIAPGQAAPVVRRAASGSARSLDLLWWGLVPHWAKDEKIGTQTINARAETADVRPAFRSAFRHRRCLVPADGFFEWKQVSPKKKQPYFIRRKDAAPLAYAGLWEQWRRPDDPEREEIETYTILTVPANDLLRPLHERMPAILGPEDFDRWLDPDLSDPETVKPLLRTFPADMLESYPVSTFVNRPANDGPRCVERAAPESDTEDAGLFST
jgi:putative SOS response-associated peptidase YedK